MSTMRPRPPKDIPLLFTDEMIRRIVAGKKTQSRRPLRPQPQQVDSTTWRWSGWIFDGIPPDRSGEILLGQGIAATGRVHSGEPEVLDGIIRRASTSNVLVHGDVIVGREAWRTHEREPDMVDGVLYRADGSFRPIENTREAADAWILAHDNGKHGNHWRSSMHMPRWASRLTLEVTAVRVERLRDITEDDAVSEGLDGAESGEGEDCPGRHAFADTWDGIYAARGLGWDANPWVIVYDWAKT
jgi:hypothetical protein